MPRKIALLAVTILLAGCASHAAPIAAPPIPKKDALMEPNEAKSDQLQYDDEEKDTFAPVLTARGSYPTQKQAYYAVKRNASPEFAAVSQVRIFACGKGYVSETTARHEDIDAPVVICATDLINRQGQVRRVPLNYYYLHEQWLVQNPSPPYGAPYWRVPSQKLKKYRKGK